MTSSQHDTKLGPAHGGTRAWAYADEDAALTDALRLSRAMTLKNAMAELPLGGGKSVILLDQGQSLTEAMLLAFGHAVESLSGRYILAEDVGMGPEAVATVARATRFACGVPSSVHDADQADPAPLTARGVVLAMERAVALTEGMPTFSDCTVAVQGLGGVGWNVCRALHQRGTRLVVTDIDSGRVARARSEFGADAVDPDQIHRVPADVLAPCALGATMNHDTIPELTVRLVCGGANNQLATADAGRMLLEANITYAPDFVVNAGGVTHTSAQITGIDAAEEERRINAIPDRLEAVLSRSRRDNVPSQETAEAMALEIIARAAPAGRP